MVLKEWYFVLTVYHERGTTDCKLFFFWLIAGVKAVSRCLLNGIYKIYFEEIKFLNALEGSQQLYFGPGDTI